MEKENIILSICMIVKNEERCLERCLKSLTPLREQMPCEVIITDTGSTDRTLEIAEKYADKILHFEWCNDFSAARNVGMEEAKGEWIMVIDADEEVTEDVSHLVEFFTSEQRHQYIGCFLKKKNCSNAELCSKCESLKDYDGPSSDFLDYRAFRADLKPRYQGIIHETVPYREPTYTFNTLVLYHDGYAYEDAEKRKDKGRRNASLLEKQIKENLHDLRAITHILREEDVLNKDVYQNLILLTEDIMYKNLGSMFAPYSFAKVADYYQSRDVEKSLKICKDYIRFYADEKCELFEIDIRFTQIKCLFNQKQYAPTLKMIERYLELMEKYEKEEMNVGLLRTASPMYANKGAKEYAQYLQIQCYLHLKNIEKASELLKKVDFNKVTKGGFYNFFIMIIQMNHVRGSSISLTEYYPILSKARKGERADIKESANQVFNVLQKHIKNLPDKVRNAVFAQIAYSEEGKADLQEMIDKAKEEQEQKKQELSNVIEDTKKTIKEIMKEEDMKDKALDLAKRLEKLSPDDEEIKELIKELS